MATQMPRSGWYPDPSGPGQRYFDGVKWTEHHVPPPPQPTIVINNNNAVNAGPAIVVARGPNHALHLILTLLTCGFWLPVWVIVTVASHTQAGPGGQSNKTALIIAAVIGGMAVLGVVGEHPVVLLPVAAIAGLGYLAYREYERGAERRAEQARIAARADAENQALMFGDPSGMYGQYPPPPMPPDDRA